MIGDISQAEHIYVACGYTDMRKSIDGLAATVQQSFHLEPFSSNLFLFCGRRRDRIKVLFWEGDGFILLNKLLETGSFQWLEVRTKSNISLSSSFVGLWKD